MVKENKKKALLILSGLLLLIGWFYWFQWRPIQIRNYCDQIAWTEADYEWDNRYNNIIHEDTYDWKYTQCLHGKGLK